MKMGMGASLMAPMDVRRLDRVDIQATNIPPAPGRT